MKDGHYYPNLLNGILPVLPYSCQTRIIDLMVSESNKIVCPHQL